MSPKDSARPWWYPLGDGDPQEEQCDDGLQPCPHCMGQGCGRCRWAGVVAAPAIFYKEEDNA